MDAWEVDTYFDKVEFDDVYGPPVLEYCSYIFIKSGISDNGIVISESDDGVFLIKRGTQDGGNVYLDDEEIIIGDSDGLTEVVI